MSLGKFSNSAPASVTTGAAPFTLAAGEDIFLLVDGPPYLLQETYAPAYGGDPVHVVFTAAQFANIAAATAPEVAAAINAAALAQAAAGQPPALVATVSGSDVVITATGGSYPPGGSQSNREPGPSIQVVQLTDNLGAITTGTANAALGLTQGIYNPTGFTGVGAQPSSPIFHDVLTFAGDSSYPTGGSAGFSALVQSFFGDGRKVLAVIGQDCGGFVPVYVPSTDKLKVYESTDQAAEVNAPMSEVANTTNLSATTFNVLVISA